MFQYEGIKSRNTADLWPLGIMYLKAQNQGLSVAASSWQSSSAHHQISGLGLISATPCFGGAAAAQAEG